MTEAPPRLAASPPVNRLEERVRERDLDDGREAATPLR
jgi:hypothetical protein